MRIKAIVIESKLRGVGSIEKDVDQAVQVGDVIETETLFGIVAKVRVVEVIKSKDS